MSAKEMIDDLLIKGKITPSQHVAIQLTIAGEKLDILPDDEQTAKWFDENIGLNEDCSASSGIYKFRMWLNERFISQS